MTCPFDLLFVDDDRDIRTIVALSLALDPTITLRSAGSGAEALELLRTGDWRPDAILLDVMMPGMTGPALAAAIRQLPGCDAVPLLFMTARARAGDIVCYRACGAAGVIAKPFDPLNLAREVRARLAAGTPPTLESVAG